MKRWFLALLVACAACDSVSLTDVLEPAKSVECPSGGTDVCTETGSVTLEVFVVTVTR